MNDVMTMTLSFVVVAAVLGMVGRGILKMVFGTGPRAGHKGWKGVFYVTMWAHPLVAGACIGLIPGLPAPDALGGELVGHVLWYTLAGGSCFTILRAWESWIKQRAANTAKRERPGPYSAT